MNRAFVKMKRSILVALPSSNTQAPTAGKLPKEQSKVNGATKALLEAAETAEGLARIRAHEVAGASSSSQAL